VPKQITCKHCGAGGCAPPAQHFGTRSATSAQQPHQPQPTRPTRRCRPRRHSCPKQRGLAKATPALPMQPPPKSPGQRALADRRQGLRGVRPPATPLSRTRLATGRSGCACRLGRNNLAARRHAAPLCHPARRDHKTRSHVQCARNFPALQSRPPRCIAPMLPSNLPTCRQAGAGHCHSICTRALQTLGHPVCLPGPCHPCR
jgi:hypothetical protein